MLEFEVPVELPMPVRAGHHYLVPRAGRRVLAGTTSEYAGFNKEVTAEGLRSIIEGGLRFAPLLRDLRFRRAWAGLRPDTPDHLPVLGHSELENLVFATGHFRNGILLAPVTAQLISEVMMTGSTSRSMDPYLPSRFGSRRIPATKVFEG
jgi:glycine oxidase